MSTGIEQKPLNIRIAARLGDLYRCLEIRAQEQGVDGQPASQAWDETAGSFRTLLDSILELDLDTLFGSEIDLLPVGLAFADELAVAKVVLDRLVEVPLLVPMVRNVVHYLAVVAVVVSVTGDR